MNTTNELFLVGVGLEIMLSPQHCEDLHGKLINVEVDVLGRDHSYLL